MQAGFGILEAGSVQDKNTRAILFKNMLDLCVTGLVRSIS
jgi:ammonia channel protein AmtB